MLFLILMVGIHRSCILRMLRIGFFCYSNADCLNHSYCETTPVNENDRLHLHYASWKTDGQRCRQVAQPFLDREAYGAAKERISALLLEKWIRSMPNLETSIASLLLEPSLPLASVIVP
jgi:hypothetical protein